ncbi:hypothetical protein ACEPAF_8197 [Sanghuangporus sanghuang]
MDPHTPNTATSQFIQADDDDYDEDALPSFGGELDQNQNSTSATSLGVKGKGRAQPYSTTGGGGGGGGGSSNSNSQGLSGNIGSGGGTGGRGGAGKQGSRRTVGGVRVETRYTGVDTLDEPITATIARDLRSISVKIAQVLYPSRSGAGREVLRDWDLWGPLILCLVLGILLSLSAPAEQSLGVFTAVVMIICLGSVVVTIQAKLLGGRVSFFQALCALGYCVAPLDVAALVSYFVRTIWVRIPISLGAWAWCIWASVNFLDGTKIEQQRILLAVYPLLLFYFILAWMILIQ